MTQAFLLALRKVLKSEGYYVNDPADRGGETYQGIARNYHPYWMGWSIVDQVKAERGGKLCRNFEIKDPKIKQLVADFYHSVYWKGFRCDQIENPNVAAIVFDFVMGSGKAVQVIQRMLNRDFRTNISVDNQIGAETIGAINAQNPQQFFEALKSSRIAYYNTLGQPRFTQGWTNRVNRYKWGEFEQA